MVRSGESAGSTGRRRLTGGPASATLIPGALIPGAIVVIGLAAVDPIGWDRFGPVRWLLLPALGFWFIADRVGRVGRGTGTDRWAATMMGRAWAGLLLWGLGATILAADPLHAWLGTPDRRFGWLTWLLCGGLFAAATTATAAERAIITRAFAVGAALSGCYTIAEWAGPVGDLQFAGGRLGGPFGQPAYLGAAAALALPVAIGMAVDRDEAQWWRMAGLLGAAGAIVSLLGSQSRAAWIGLLMAAVVGAIATRRRRPPAEILLPVAIAGVAVVIIPAFRSRITSSFGDGGVVQGRLDEWQVGWRALRQSPVVGYGPEGYRTVFGTHVDSDYVISWGRDVITDRAHSGLLDTALSFGVPGGLAYGVLMALTIAAAVRAIARRDRTKFGLAIGVMAYAAQQQLLFPLSELDPLLWIAAGLLVATDSVTAETGTTDTATSDTGTTDTATGSTAAAEADRGLPAPSFPIRLSPLLSAVRGLAIGLAVLVTIGGLADLVANVALASALDRTDAGAALSDVDTAITLRPDSIRYRFIASRLADRSGLPELALSHIEDGLIRSPTDPALRSEEGRLRLERARAARTEPDQSRTLAEAIDTLEALVADDPNHPEQLQRLGIALARNGEYDRAVELLERAVLLAPDSPEPSLNLAEVRRLAEQNG